MDKSTLFYLLITVSLITLIVFNYFTKPPPSIVSLSDIRIELETDKAEYSVNEDIEVTVYLCNDKPHAVRIEKIIEYNSIGYSLADPDRKVGVDLGHGYPENVYIQIPPNSRIKIHTVTFTPKYPGDFFIKILGESITVKVENEEISKQNKIVLKDVELYLAFEELFKGWEREVSAMVSQFGEGGVYSNMDLLNLTSVVENQRLIEELKERSMNINPSHKGPILENKVFITILFTPPSWRYQGAGRRCQVLFRESELPYLDDDLPVAYRAPVIFSSLK